MPLFHVHGLVASTLATLATGGTVIAPRASEPRRSGPTQCRTARPGTRPCRRSTASFHRRRSVSPSSRCASPAPAPRRLPRRCWPVRGAPSAARPGLRHDRGGPPDGVEPAAPGRAPAGRRPRDRHEVAILDEDWRPLPTGESARSRCAAPRSSTATATTPRRRRGVPRRLVPHRRQRVAVPDGYLTLAGRIKELINRGGEKISPLRGRGRAARATPPWSRP